MIQRVGRVGDLLICPLCKKWVRVKRWFGAAHICDRR